MNATITETILTAVGAGFHVKKSPVVHYAGTLADSLKMYILELAPVPLGAWNFLVFILQLN
jgi:hypothetical protein